MAHVVQHAVVDGLADVAHRPLWVGGSDDLVRARGVFISGEDPNFTPGHLLFMDVHRLQTRGESTGRWGPPEDARLQRSRRTASPPVRCD